MEKLKGTGMTKYILARTVELEDAIRTKSDDTSNKPGQPTNNVTRVERLKWNRPLLVGSCSAVRCSGHR
jgi:hypothetical protein